MYLYCGPLEGNGGYTVIGQGGLRGLGSGFQTPKLKKSNFILSLQTNCPVWPQSDNPLMELPILAFNPDDPGVANGRYFGMPFAAEQAELVLLSVPWEVTTSYGKGTLRAPQAIMDASLQVDLFDLHYPEGWKRGIGTLDIDTKWASLSDRLRGDAEAIMEELSWGGTLDTPSMQRKLQRVNEGSRQLNEYVYDQATQWLDRGKTVGLVGGDHSVPLGLIRAVAERHPGLGILHVDAHADLRQAYEGFVYSHASIMYNVLQEAPGVSALVQVAVRDEGEAEYRLANSDSRITQFTDVALGDAESEGESWDSVCGRIIGALPEVVYVSFDIDGLSPDNCPHTGTPVPGGLSFRQAVYLLNRLVRSGRRVVGFDLCEVSPSGREGDEWDANVGARMLYKLCNFTLLSSVRG